MKFKNSLKTFSIVPFVVLVFFMKKAQPISASADEGWIGSITYDYFMIDQGSRVEQDVTSEWKYMRRASMIIVVNRKDTGYAHIQDHLSNWQQIISPYIKQMKSIQVTTATESGAGSGDAGVWVEIDKEAGRYWLKVEGPNYKFERTSRIWSNIIEMAGGDQPEDTSSGEKPSFSITIPDQYIGKDPKHLSGSYVVTQTTTTKVLVTWSLRKKCPPWNNPLTQTNISGLNKKVQSAATKFIKRCNDELCIRLKVVSGYRTNQEQDALYAQGRTKPGIIVTNAKGGQSNHNNGSAIDVYVVKDDGTIDLKGTVPPEVVEIARQEGFEWGGNWQNFKDYPHFEMKI